jgi:cation:H+ antiporter
MPFGLSPTLVGAVVFLAGVLLVVESVETFVENVAEGAAALGVSGFFLTVLLAGTDLENAVLGVAAVVDRLPELALGTVFGEALFVLGAAVGLAGVLTPFETTVPRSYLALFLGTPALFLVLALDGTLTRGDGIVLTLAYLPLLVAVYLLESRADTRYLAAEALEAADGENGSEGERADGEGDGRADPNPGSDVPTASGVERGGGATTSDGSEAEANRGGDRGGDGERGSEDDTAPDPESALDADPDLDLDLDLDLDVDSERIDAYREHHERRYRLAVVLLATLGMIVGSELAVSGAETLLSAFGVTGLAFGATVVSFVASLEEVALTLEPVRRGAPHLGVGNVVGSSLFFVTANAGVLALLQPIDTSGAVFTVHWPFFLVALLLVAGVFRRGRVGRASGAVLLATYAAYWGANYLV